MKKSFFSNAVNRIITVVSVVLIIFTVIFSNQTGQIDIRVGDVSSEDIYASRSIIDTITTNAARDAAKKSVADVYVANDDKRLSAVDNISDFFATATILRNSKEKNVSATAAQLKAKAKLDISEETALSVIRASSEQFSTMRQIGDIVNEKMTEGISDISAASEACRDKIQRLGITDGQKSAANEIVSLVLTENLELSKEETARRKEAAASAVPAIEYKKNQIIIRKGEIVSEAQLEMLKQLGLLKGANPFPVSYTAGVLILIFASLVIIICFYYNQRSKKEASVPITAVTGLLMVLVSYYGSKFIPEDMVPFLPAGLFPGIVTIFSSTPAAIVSNIILSVLCAIAFNTSWDYAVSLIIAGTLSSYCFSAVKRRSHLLPASIISSIFYGLTYCSMSLIEAGGALNALMSFAKGFCGGFLSGLITIGSLPLIEWIFNATTPMKLSELANPENKLLKKLLVEAPGTYHHSLTVANISEIAARSIHADSLLARVGAYYHDIGKLRHPLYFKENQYDKNAHDTLSPEESSSLIISHVKDGVDIAEKNRLPKSITDIIAQHHGTTTTGYFLIRAKELNPDTDEAKFTYPGPSPQTKEAAIVMLADSCEAAVRSIQDKTEEKIESMVRRITTDRVNSGQFSHCNMTFEELETVIKVITKTLGGYFHERIKYE